MQIETFELSKEEKNAIRKAESYLDFMAFSRKGLIEQLMFEGFSREQAEYGVTAVGLFRCFIYSDISQKSSVLIDFIIENLGINNQSKPHCCRKVFSGSSPEVTF